MKPIQSNVGTLYGIGVGPGPSGYLPIASYEAMKRSDMIICPRASHKQHSVARQCVSDLALDPERLIDIPYNMDFSRKIAGRQYDSLADRIAVLLEQGKDVSYLTIGDSMTYSTYCYLLKAMKDRMPGFKSVTMPGITSYNAVAASFNWPVGLGRERVLILPCPDDMVLLEKDIREHDVVVLMKIGGRLHQVVELLFKIGIAEYCVFAHRIGLTGEYRAPVSKLVPEEEGVSGYLSTILIRKISTEQVSEGVGADE